MLYTKANVQENIRNRQGKRVFYLAFGDRLTSEARDWLQAQRIEILSAEQAKPESYRLANGAVLYEKPEYMTHLNGEVLVPKNHPRIKFRGAMDTLQSSILLVQKELTEQEKALQEILELTRRLIRCDVLDEPVGDFTLCGLTQQEQRQHSHFPQKYYNTPHFMPTIQDPLAVLKLNHLRTLARQAELAAVEAFCTADGIPQREDIMRALNRVSSMLYILMIREKAGTRS